MRNSSVILLENIIACNQVIIHIHPIILNFCVGKYDGEFQGKYSWNRKYGASTGIEFTFGTYKLLNLRVSMQLHKKYLANLGAGNPSLLDMENVTELERI